MKKTKHFQNLSVVQRANLFKQLTRLEEAGISPIQTVSCIIEPDSTLNIKLNKPMNFLRDGHSMSESGYRTGLFNKLDSDLIKTAE